MGNSNNYSSNYDEMYWRFGAILSATSSFVSVFVVLYFLIIREHPDRPDETDAKEREKFFTIQSHNGNNLFNEIVSRLKVNFSMKNCYNHHFSCFLCRKFSNLNKSKKTGNLFFVFFYFY
jgi:hypothetical protein